MHGDAGRTDRAARVRLGVAVATALVAAAGCASQTSPLPPAPGGAAQELQQAPTSAPTTGPPSGAHRGTVDANTYKTVVAAMKAAGMRMSDETGLRMTYGSDKQHVTVTGSMMTSGGGGMMGASSKQVGSAEMVFEGGRWVISAVN